MSFLAVRGREGGLKERFAPLESNLARELQNLLGRFCLMAILLFLEFFFRIRLPHWFDYEKALVLLGATASATYVLIAWTYLKSQATSLPFRPQLLVVHFFALATCIAGARPRFVDELSPSGVHALHIAIDALLLTTLVSLALSFVPLPVWLRTLRETKGKWLLSTMVALPVTALEFVFFHTRYLTYSAPLTWLRAQALFFAAAISGHLLHGISVDTGAFTIHGPRETVQVSMYCSGVEGLLLVFLFASGWICLFSKELRAFRATLLLVLALAVIWWANIVRLAALVVLCNVADPRVSVNGFHAVGGWLMFITVALAFSIACQRFSWVRKVPTALASARDGAAEINADGINAAVPAPESTAESPLTGVFVVPFLVVLTASFATRMVSLPFDWLYPLRFTVGALALWHFRSKLKHLNWRFGGRALLTGSAVFLLWIAPSAWFHVHDANSLGIELGAFSIPMRIGWIFFRVLTAVTVVPICEELAFRGFLLRRIVARQFERIPYTGIALKALLISSLAFGLMHGSRWIVGTLAGLAFAALLRKSGRIGDAVAAHAFSNLLMAAWVLVTGDWSQW